MQCKCGGTVIVEYDGYKNFICCYECDRQTSLYCVVDKETEKVMWEEWANIQKDNTMDIQKYIDWAKENDGSVDIDIKRDGEVMVWCYLFKVSSGVSIQLGDDPPNAEEAIAEKKARLERELKILG